MEYLRADQPDDIFSGCIDDPKLLAGLAAVPQAEQTPWMRSLSRAAAATDEGLKLFEYGFLALNPETGRFRS